jgi:UDP-glucuronate 4-epimerase
VTGPVLVTGGAGFIGSHLVDSLVSRGRPVVCVDNFDEYYPEGLKRRNIERALESGIVELVQADIRDESALAAAFAGSTFSAVVHLAARPGVRPSLENPAPYIDINVTGTLNVLRAAVAGGAERIIFASSSSVYGSVTEKVREDAELRPLSPYAASKVAGEALCRAYQSLSGIPTVVLRFFNAYGPRQRPDMAINKFTDCIVNGSEMPVYGDGTSHRDYTYIDDMIRGVNGALEARLDGFRVFNLGGAHPVQLMALIRLLEGHLGRKARVRFEPMGPGEPNMNFADIGAASRELGFAPTTSIEEGTGRYAGWYRETQDVLAAAV